MYVYSLNRLLNLQCITSNLDIDKLKSLKVAQVKDEKDGDEDDGCDDVCDGVIGGERIDFWLFW